MASAAGGGRQLFPGITDARQAGITDHRQGFAIGQASEQFWDAALLVVLMKAHQFGLDAKAMQQQAAVAGVFAGHPVHSCQQLLSAG